MPLRKLTTIDGFVAMDLDAADHAVGVVRLAPKVLVDGAWMLARSTTYTFAVHGVRAGGVSAGINAKADARDAAVAAFVEEVGAFAGEAGLHLSPSTGLTGDDLAALGPDPLDPVLTARGAIAAAAAFLDGGLEGRTVAVVGTHPAADAARAELTRSAATLVEGATIDAEADAVLVAGRVGVVDHGAAATVRATVVGPLTPVPVTAKAHAVLGRAGVRHVPDFVALSAPLLATVDPDATDPVGRVAALAAELAPRGTDAWREAVDRAESFLRTWRDELPFGRPLG